MKTLVMKFGGAAVATPKHFSKIADIILHRYCEYQRIAVVISAMGGATDQLIALAKEVNENPPRREYDMLVSVGERVSISLLAMALAAKNHQAISFTGSQSGIITCENHSYAKIVDVKPHRLIPVLDMGSTAIVAGFQGVSRHGEITTLGRGGSDTSAVALAIALKAEKVEFFKDVAGICLNDPKLDPTAVPIPFLSYEEALSIINQGAKVLQARSLLLALKNQMPMHILSFQDYHSNKQHLGTFIGSSRKTSSINPVYESE